MGQELFRTRSSSPALTRLYRDAPNRQADLTPVLSIISKARSYIPNNKLLPLSNSATHALALVLHLAPRKMNKQRLSALTQRLPIITHIAVLILATFGPWFCPQLVAVVFFCTNIAFVSSQVRMAYGMIRYLSSHDLLHPLTSDACSP